VSDVPANAPYRDASQPIEKRVRDLLGRMTLAEKIAQLTSVWLQLEPGGAEFAPFQGTFARPRPVRLEHGIGQITRPLGSRPIEAREGARALNAFQRRLVEGTRLGIPALAHEEALTGLMALGATQFPSPLNYGATWDPELIERVGAVIRRQMLAVGARQALAPVCDVIRDARWGRVEECIAEDAYLVGAIASAYVRGLQGDDPRAGVVATLKHFAGYSASEGGRNFAPAHAGARELADVLLLPFEMAVKTAGALSVMNAYNEIDGIPCAASRALLTGTLRERWGFAGIVVADYFAVRMLESVHHVAANAGDAAALALGAGLDVELPTDECFPEGIPAALERGALELATVDRAVERVLELKLRLGLLERPYVDADAIVLEAPGDRALARRVAERSIVLLSNDGVLPLRPDLRRVAVIGPNADDAAALLGNYTFHNHVATHFPDQALAPPGASVLARLRARLGDARVSFAPGCRILEAPGELSTDTSGFASAVAAAREADVAIVVVGDRAGHFRRGTVGEGTDTDDLALPGVQQALVEAVAASGTPVVVLLVNGRPFALERVAGRAAAIVEAWFPGEEGAEAIAAVLCGESEPGGRTTVTFSKSAGAQPRFHDHKPIAAGAPRSPAFAPVFPFGHGLSYTSFEYADLSIEPREVATDGEVTVSFALANTGARAGDEVVQLYLRDPVASVTRPVRELRGFRRVRLEPGERCRVTFRLSAELASFTGPDLVRIVEPGEIRVMIGASSADVRLEGSFTITGRTRDVGEDRVLSSQCVVERER
jgi:beta-glucosidase-like glycosyl hydrolase